MDDYKIQQRITEWLESDSDFTDLTVEAEQEHKDIHEAWESCSDQAVDNVSADMCYFVDEWMERHGCQIIEMIKDKLTDQEPDYDASITRMREKIAVITSEISRIIEDGGTTGEDLVARIGLRQKEIASLKDAILEIEEDDNE